VDLTEEMKNAFSILPVEAVKGKTDLMLVFESEQQIRDLIPRLSQISTIAERGVIVTAKGEEVDFVSRFFAPQSGIDEDPVTGSAHTTLIPYWSKKLNKGSLSAMQLSKRKGYLQCRFLGERVEISGQAALYLTGEIFTE
jgi:predicted PhzF superfamily epimerase YddE/YHI9